MNLFLKFYICISIHRKDQLCLLRKMVVYEMLHLMTIFRIVLLFGKWEGDRAQKKNKAITLVFCYLSRLPLFTWFLTADLLWWFYEILSLLICNLRSTHPHTFLSFSFESEARAVPWYFSSDSCREWKMLLGISFVISFDERYFYWVLCEIFS